MKIKNTLITTLSALTLITFLAGCSTTETTTTPAPPTITQPETTETTEPTDPNETTTEIVNDETVNTQLQSQIKEEILRYYYENDLDWNKDLYFVINENKTDLNFYTDQNIDDIVDETELFYKPGTYPAPLGYEYQFETLNGNPAEIGGKYSTSGTINLETIKLVPTK